MARKVIILDTSILCVWLGIPGMDRIEKKGEMPIVCADVEAKLQTEIDGGARIVLPFASVIECGNHITQIKGADPKKYIDEFADFILKSIDGQEPWDIFTNQTNLFDEENFKKLVEKWRELSMSGISMGDASIIQVAHHYDSNNFTVEIYTGDTGLKAYEPTPKKEILPRNKGRR
ncbi:MAG: hypothetical protein K2M83_07130 [Muribaculaceae bacterium]|nr:hypothetical protein [Muribaculaceae bacterium]